MSFVASFSASQNTSSPDTLSLLDTSTGSDGAIVSRYVFLRLSDGSYLKPAGQVADYISWPIADGNAIGIDLLDRDYAIYAVVIYVDVNGNTLYSAATWFVGKLYSEQFDYSLTQRQASNPKV